jgi:UPF0716 family protein affecting phage T7 exclusion
MLPRLCFAENTFFPYKYFIANFIIIINTFFTQIIKISLTLPIVSNFLQSAMKGMSNNISRSSFTAPGEAFYCMVGRANHHDALVRTASMKLVATESAMSSSEVRIKDLNLFQVRRRRNSARIETGTLWS